MSSAAERKTMGVDLERVRASIAPVLSAHAVALVDLEWFTDQGGWILRLTIERANPGSHSQDSALDGPTVPGAGVTLADCADVSRDVSSVLDVEDLIQSHYSLEVSSPGLDRKIRGKADFDRFVGRLARVKLARPASDGQRLLRGRLEVAPPALIAVNVDGKRIEAPIGDVTEANLVFELAPQPKKGSHSSAGRSPQGRTPRKSRNR
jgi:ribosome maturation factor RimP